MSAKRRIVFAAGRICVLACLLAASATLSAEPMRTGMAEAGLRVWKVARTDRADNTVDQTLLGVSLARFLNDNISLGFEVAAFLDGMPSDSVIVDVRSRLYWFPLSHLTPWTELRGGAALGMPEGNALRLGGAMGIRWVPDVWSGSMAIDVQLVGVERWKQDWPAEFVEEGPAFVQARFIDGSLALDIVGVGTAWACVASCLASTGCRLALLTPSASRERDALRWMGAGNLR